MRMSTNTRMMTSTAPTRVMISTRLSRNGVFSIGVAVGVAISGVGTAALGVFADVSLISGVATGLTIADVAGSGHSFEQFK